MISDWKDAIAFVLKEEGGYGNDPADRGGETNFGISKRSYPNEDIKGMTVERASAIYENDFWRVCRCDELPSPLAIAVFDAAVNQGTNGAARMLQIALEVNVDAVIGPKTVAAAHAAGAKGVRRFLAQRMARYIRTIMKDHTQEVFAENWSSRLMRCAELVMTPKAVA